MFLILIKWSWISTLFHFPEWEGEAGGKWMIACANVSKRQLGQCQLANTTTVPKTGTKSITWSCSEVTCYIIFSTSLAERIVLCLMEHAFNSQWYFRASFLCLDLCSFWKRSYNRGLCWSCISHTGEYHCFADQCMLPMSSFSGFSLHCF